MPRSARPVPWSANAIDFELAQTVGSLRFSTLTLDYRRYLPLVRPFTLAVRALHFGRHGSVSEDLRLSPLFLGYPTLVRGYDVNSFGAGECVANRERVPGV